MRAVVYTRVSSDPRATGRSVAEQEEECRATCERNGWEIVEVLTDNDRSASRYATKTRPAWARVGELIGSGAVDVLVTWEASRAQRDLGAFVELRDLCRANGVRWSYSGRLVDLDDSSDSFTSALDALVAEREAEETARRVRRSKASAARAGRPDGRVAFGYRRVYDDRTGELVGQVPDKEQAAVLKEAARRVLSGESVRSICADFTSRGITTATGAEWSLSTLKRVLVSPTYAGMRIHRGEIIGPAQWEPIFDQETHSRLVAVLTDPSRRTTRRRERMYLLSGVARCGRCGSPMNKRTEWKSGRETYLCRKNMHVVIQLEALDDFISRVVIERLSRADALSAIADETPPDAVIEARAEIDELRQRMDEAAGQFASGDISAAMLSRVEVEIGERISQAEQRARFAGLPAVGREVADADDVAGAWDRLDIERKAELVRALMHVVIKPAAVAGRRTFDPDRVEISWRV